MQMESSRRSSLDRFREPGLKKPRLAEEAERDLGPNGVIPDRDRTFLPRAPPPGAAAGHPSASRIRANERERDARGGPLRGSLYNQKQQMQELVAQYKTALAELTFNSKPIITNLTIIAGENLHAAKGIASTIFANILEVPSEQKLPSLYLLDSIVKNIGRDYIKYFAAKLPEVFCKAYKQVDPSMHSGMRHLFGTWRGVFPPAPLQIIEKELGFSPITDGSSSGATTSRPDSQAKRPPNSIHVNPKYLEARQRFQQSTQVKEGSSDDIGSVVTTAEDADRPDRTSTIVGSRLWMDPVKNIQRPHRELSKEPVREKNPSIGYGDHEFSSDYSQHSDLGIQRASERVTERDTLVKPWYGIGGSATEASVDQKNSFDVNRAYGNSRASRTAQPVGQLSSNYQNAANKSNQITSQNWKNSEEEEYMWDDMHSRSTDQGWTDSSMKVGWNPDDEEKPASFQRGRRMTLEMEHLDGQRNKLNPYSQLGKASGRDENVPSFKEIEGILPPARGQHDTGARANREASAESLLIGGAAFGHQTPKVWPSQESLHPVADLSHTGIGPRISRRAEGHQGHPVPIGSGLSTSLISSLARTGLPHMGPSVAAVPSSLGSLANVTSGLGGSFGKQPLTPVSPSSNSPASSVPLLHQNLHSSADHDHLQPQKFSQTYQEPMQLPGQSNRAVSPQLTQDSFPIMPPNHIQKSHILSNLQQPSSQTSENMQTSSVSSMPFAQLQPHLSFLQQASSDLSLQQTQKQSQPSIPTQNPLPPPRTGGPNGTSSLNILGRDILNQSTTSNLLVAIMNSGLLSNSSSSSLQKQNIQPPLPSGPPPAQVLTAEKPSVLLSSILGPLSHDKKPTVAARPPRPVLPPLPPGPPPSSSLVGTSSEVSNTTDKNPNPLSSLLSSLVARGLISSPAAELSNITSAEIPNSHPNQSVGLASSAPMPVTSASASSIASSSPSSDDLSSPKSPSPTGVALSKAASANLKDLIGIDFKPEIMRELHPLVINDLFDELKHQCVICGLRFRLQQQLNTHLEWHASKKTELVGSLRASRKWYANSRDWVAGSVESSSGSLHTASPERMGSVLEKCEPMVPADESQSICALCGEPFEDFYCEGRDEWMYKGTVYMSLPTQKGDENNSDERGEQGIIVHDKCVSKSLTDDMEVAENDNMNLADG